MTELLHSKLVIAIGMLVICIGGGGGGGIVVASFVWAIGDVPLILESIFGLIFYWNLNFCARFF